MRVPAGLDSRRKELVSLLVTGCFEPSQPLGITSGLKGEMSTHDGLGVLHAQPCQDTQSIGQAWLADKLQPHIRVRSVTQWKRCFLW